MRFDFDCVAELGGYHVSVFACLNVAYVLCMYAWYGMVWYVFVYLCPLLLVGLRNLELCNTLAQLSESHRKEAEEFVKKFSSDAALQLMIHQSRSGRHHHHGLIFIIKNEKYKYVSTDAKLQRWCKPLCIDSTLPCTLFSTALRSLTYMHTYIYVRTFESNLQAL